MITIIFGLVSLKLAFLSFFSGVFIILQKYRIHKFGKAIKEKVKRGEKVNLNKSVDNFLNSHIMDFQFRSMVE